MAVDNASQIDAIANDKENALLVPDNDDKAMAKVILDLLEDQEKVNLITRNARSFIAQMDWKAVKEEWKGVLKLERG